MPRRFVIGFCMDQGVVVEEGPPEVVFKNPVKDRTREFLRKHIEGAK